MSRLRPVRCALLLAIATCAATLTSALRAADEPAKKSPAPATSAAASTATPAPAAPQPKQFVYVLKLVPRLHDDAAWTDADKQAVGAHFARLQAATKTGQVILAARTFMAGDPAVTAGVMTATVHPYAVALLRK